MSLISELQRRGVFRTAAGYAVVAWLLIQVLSILIPTFGLPDKWMAISIILFVIGFPITLILSWVFDVTSEGVRRTDEMTEDSPHSILASRTFDAVIIGVLAAAVLLFAIDKYFWRGVLPATANVKSLAVLPFIDLSQEDVTSPFALGMHDDVLTQLSMLNAIETVSRNAVMRYQGSDLSSQQIAEELGVDTVLEGRVRRDAALVRINMELINPTSSRVLWAENFERELSAANIFEIQSEIAKAIASTLSITLSPPQIESLEDVPTDSLVAYDAYQRGRQAMNERTPAGFETALAEFDEAIKADHLYAQAHAAACRTRLFWYELSRNSDLLESARGDCHQAQVLNEDSAGVYVARGMLFRFLGDYEASEAELKQAVALSPDDVDVHIQLGELFARQGRLGDAENALHRAESLQPDYWAAQDALANFYYRYDARPGRYQRATEHFENVVALQPENAPAYTSLGAAYYMMGDYSHAAEAYQQSLQITETRNAYTNLGLMYYYTGRFEEAVEMQSKAIELAPNDHRLWGRLAESWRFVPDDAKATEAYLQAIEFAEANVAASNNSSDWDTLGLLSLYYAHTDQRDLALTRINDARQDRDEPNWHYYRALIELEFGNNNEALDELELAVNLGFPKNLIMDDPDLQTLAGDGRYQALLARAQIQ